MDYMISGKDILEAVKLINHNAPKRMQQFLQIPRIISYSILPTTLENNKVYFILYESAPLVGHWTLLFYNHLDDIWEFFDPYGFIIDDELKFTCYDEDVKLQKPLIEILTKYGNEFEINTYPYQELAENINTCGRWCIIRYYFYAMGGTNSEFLDYFKNMDDSDMCDMYYEIFNI